MKFGLLADHVSQGERGKLSIIGEFDRIAPPSVPFAYGHFFLVARFEAAVTEGSEHNLNVALVDQDGTQVVPRSPDLAIVFNPTGRARPLRANVIMNFNGLQLPSYNDYEFHLLVDGRIVGNVPLIVVRPDELPT